MSNEDEVSHLATVDVHPDGQRATEPDEQAVLAQLYGPADAAGFYRGPSLNEQAGRETAGAIRDYESRGD